MVWMFCRVFVTKCTGSYIAKARPTMHCIRLVEAMNEQEEGLGAKYNY